MSGQTTYEAAPPKGFVGLLAEPFSLNQVDSGLVAGGGDLGLGRAVKPGTNDGEYIICAADDAVAGVSIFAHHNENQSGDMVYKDKQAFPVLSKGRYWATANAAIAIGTEMGWDPATTKVGAVVGTTTTLAFGVAKTSSAADGDLIIVEVNF